MTTTELIKELRAKADVLDGGSDAALLDEAADQIEDMDERLSITSSVMSDMQDEMTKVTRRANRLNGLILVTAIAVCIWVLVR